VPETGRRRRASAPVQADGSFELPGLEPGEHAVLALPAGIEVLHGPDFTRETREVTEALLISELNDPRIETIVLEPGEHREIVLGLHALVTLDGCVRVQGRAARSGLAVALQQVFGSWRVLRTAPIAEGGCFTLRNLPRTNLAIVVFANEEPLPRVRQVDLTGGRVRADFDFGGAAVQVEVVAQDATGAPTRDPVPHARVTIDAVKGLSFPADDALRAILAGARSALPAPPTVTTDVRGRVVIGNLPPGHYSLQARGDLWLAGAGLSLVIDDSPLTRTVTLSLRSGGEVRGLVIPAEGADGLQCALVIPEENTSPGWARVQDGRFAITSVPEGSYTLKANDLSGKNPERQLENVVVRDGQTTRVTIRLDDP